MGDGPVVAQRIGTLARADRRGAVVPGRGARWSVETHEAPDRSDAIRGFEQSAGDGLLSRDLAAGVPSALSGLTTVFGMGTGVAPTL
jgi:hypothetical protein